MAGFLENVGKIVTEKSRQAVNKASDLTELASIKNEISGLEKDIRANYEAIGKLYYEVDGKEPHELFKEQCASISATQERIAELERLSERIKNRSESPDKAKDEVVVEQTANSTDGVVFDGEVPSWDAFEPKNNDF